MSKASKIERNIKKRVFSLCNIKCSRKKNSDTKCYKNQFYVKIVIAKTNVFQRLMKWIIFKRLK